MQDVCLLQSLYSFIVNDLKRLNLKHKNNRVNKVSGGHFVTCEVCMFVLKVTHVWHSSLGAPELYVHNGEGQQSCCSQDVFGR